MPAAVPTIVGLFTSSGGGGGAAGVVGGAGGGGGGVAAIGGAAQNLLGPGMEWYNNKKAMEAAEKASKRANETQLEMYYQSREDSAPWREAGTKALERLDEKVQAGPGEFNPEEDPGYKFGYKEFVEKPLLRGSSAGGRLGGGRVQKELTRYASDYGSTKYDNFLNRWYKSLTPDQSLAGQGQTSAAQSGQNAMATGQIIGDNQMSAGAARATGYQNQGSIAANVASGVGQNTLDYYYMNKNNPSGTTPMVTPTQQPQTSTPNVTIK